MGHAPYLKKLLITVTLKIVRESHNSPEFKSNILGVL